MKTSRETRPESVALLALMISLAGGVALARRPLHAPHGAGGEAVTSFAGNARHTAIYNTAAQPLNAIRWSATIDFHNVGGAHYGAPLITAANTVLAAVKTSTDGARVDAFDGGSGAAKYSLSSDYVFPIHNWYPVYQPVLAGGPSGTRLYYAGAGGTVFYRQDPDSASGSPVRRVFYTSLSDYLANAAAFNSTVFVNTPITADSAGNVFFGFRVQGTAPAPLSTTQSGFARIDPSGSMAYVLAATAAGDSSMTRDTHSSAPALSADETTLYVVVKSDVTDFSGYLLGLDASTLATKYKVFLNDPRNGGVNPAGIFEDGTASPTVAPDGDVYFGVLGNPFNGGRGFLLRFSADLSIEKTPGAFGWDYTAAIVPSSMAPGYLGSSPYLIFSKYNNYANAGSDSGDGVNRIALLDPNATQVDSHASNAGTLTMREIMTIAGPTPDDENPDTPGAVREWCINTAAVNPATQSVFTPSEDGHIYRWNLATNSLSQVATLSEGVGEPYVPTIVGPDGTVYTLNGGTLFALGGLAGVGVALSSSAPDLRASVAGESVVFTAAVTDTGGVGSTPTGTVTFRDTVYFVTAPGTLGSTTTVLAAVPLDGSGHASCAAALAAADHFISVSYGGDSNFPPGAAMLVQKTHAAASTAAVLSAPNPLVLGPPLTLEAVIAASPPASGTPTGMVTFAEGGSILAQLPLAGGAASITTSALPAGTHRITATYASDQMFAASGGGVVQVVVAPGFPPAIAGVAPASGAPGMPVTITGTNLSGATAVAFGGAPAAFQVGSATQITASVPAAATTGPVTVTTAGGTASSASAFAVAPRITGFAPSFGPPGTRVTIDGANFDGAMSVRIGGTHAPFTVESSTRITAMVPLTASTGKIEVATPAGAAASVLHFTVRR